MEGIEKDNGKIWLFPRNALPLQHIYIIRYQMKKEITVEYMHDLLKKSVFKNVDLSKVEGMSDDERRKFTVAEADDLLGQRIVWIIPSIRKRVPWPNGTSSWQTSATP